MSNFLNHALNKTQYSTTANGAKTLESSKNACVDLFFLAGASRGNDITQVFEKAISENKEVATRILLWTRDVRGGAGERQTFRNLLIHLEKFHPDILQEVLFWIPHFGRWDDLLIFQTDNFKNQAYSLIVNALSDPDTQKLVAKWLPRPKSSLIANEIRKFIGMSPKQYRKLLVETSDTVEQKITAKDYVSIDYSKLPSLAAARLSRHFSEHDNARYTAYLESLKSGESKINAGVIFPHDIIRGWDQADSNQITRINSQWDALKSQYESYNSKILPMIDVSGSMGSQISKNLRCVDVAISLGLFLSELSSTAFKDTFATFSENSRIERVTGIHIVSRLKQICSANWGYNTNFQSMFDDMITYASKNTISKEDFPEYVLVLSDMEFDQNDRDKKTNFQEIDKKFRNIGVKRPNIIFWNLNGRSGNSPVKFDENGTAMVSGYSPAIIKSIMSGNLESISPINIMNETIMQDRYNIWK